mmetsp:Transcript_27608/g.35529  ORF Transcript_27608/g.35529 Transcript_27608/m.35529 type:complete len:153 (+) Transcript_27608:599-1057(+)
MLEVSQSSLEKAAHPVFVIPAESGVRTKCFKVVFPLSPSTNASAPSSPIFISSIWRVSNGQTEAEAEENSCDNALNPAAVMDRFLESANSCRVVAFVSAATKVCKPSSSKSSSSWKTCSRCNAATLMIAPSDTHPSLPIKTFPETLNDSKDE